MVLWIVRKIDQFLDEYFTQITVVMGVVLLTLLFIAWLAGVLK